jgi:hypothetical protein
LSEHRDESTGQFSSAEPLVGERALEADQGYIPAEEPSIEKGPEEAGELAELFADARGEPDEPEPVLGLTDPENTEPKQALSQQQLTDEITGQRLVHEAYAERVGNQEVAAFADAMRAELGPELGLTPEPAPKTEAAKPSVESAPSPEVQSMIESGVERDVAEALAKPQVRAAVEAEFEKAGQAQEAYTNSLLIGHQMLQATVAALAPQLDGMPLELWPQAIQALEQVDPVRAKLVADTLQTWGAIQEAQQHAQQHALHQQYQQFEHTVRAEDARLTEMVGKSAADEATNATISFFADHGFTRHQTADALRANPILTSAEARQTIWEAKQYQKIMNTKVTAAARPAPQVQRPGTAASAAERHSFVDSKTARARNRIDSGNGDAKDLSSLLASIRRA